MSRSFSNLVAAGATVFLLTSTSVQAGDIVAIVEDSTSKSAFLEPMSLLRSGQTIDLAADSKLTLSYFESCRRERITGGLVTIGREKSRVAGGSVNAEQLACGSGAAVPASARRTSTVTVFRAPKDGADAAASVGVRLASVFPLLVRDGGIGVLEVRRIDSPEPVMRISDRSQLHDFAVSKKRLVRGGVYLFVVDGEETRVRIARTAGGANVSPAERSVRLPTAAP